MRLLARWPLGALGPSIDILGNQILCLETEGQE